MMNYDVGALYGDRINLNAPYEIRDWCRSLKCTEEQLREAVQAVGPMRYNVTEYVNSHKNDRRWQFMRLSFDLDPAVSR